MEDVLFRVPNGSYRSGEWPSLLSTSLEPYKYINNTVDSCNREFMIFNINHDKRYELVFLFKKFIDKNRW